MPPYPCVVPVSTPCSRDEFRVALKIIKNIDRYREAAMSEVEVLEEMNSLDNEGRL